MLSLLAGLPVVLLGPIVIQLSSLLHSLSLSHTLLLSSCLCLFFANYIGCICRIFVKVKVCWTEYTNTLTLYSPFPEGDTLLLLVLFQLLFCVFALLLTYSLAFYPHPWERLRRCFICSSCFCARFTFSVFVAIIFPCICFSSLSVHNCYRSYPPCVTCAILVRFCFQSHFLSVLTSRRIDRHGFGAGENRNRQTTPQWIEILVFLNQLIENFTSLCFPIFSNSFGQSFDRLLSLDREIF